MSILLWIEEIIQEKFHFSRDLKAVKDDMSDCWTWAWLYGP